MYEFWYQRTHREGFLLIKHFYRDTFEEAVRQFDGWAELVAGTDNTFQDANGWLFQIRKAPIE